MSLKDRCEAVPQDAKAVARQPTGGQWTPRVELGETEGTAVSRALPHEADEATLIAGWQLDPDVWEIIPGTLTVNRWQQHDNCDDWLYQYKAKLIVRGENPRADVDELVAAIARRKRGKRTPPGGDHALVVNLADWQVGKAMEAGGGTPEFLDRIGACFDAIEDRLHRLRKLYQVGSVYLIGMGDLLERCQGNYPAQAFSTDLNEREQARVVRRLLLDVVDRFARLAPDVVVACVGGNHGENRQNGKSFTTPGDNLDVGVFEAVYEACQTNPEAFGHVRFHIPDESLVVALEVAGVRCAWTHGHLATRGATPQAKQLAWWQGQAFGDAGPRWTGLADAQVLTTAHYHHFSAVESHGRLWTQCPAMDGGSRWFTDATGQHSAPGTLTYLCGPRGVREIEVVA
jgi:hypothetical protein